MCVYCFQRGWMVGYSYSVQLNCQGSFPLEWPSLDHCQGPVGHGTSKLHEGEKTFILGSSGTNSFLHGLIYSRITVFKSLSTVALLLDHQRSKTCWHWDSFDAKIYCSTQRFKKNHVRKTLWSNARANVFPFFQKEDNGSMLFRWLFLQAHAILYSSFHIWLATV